jgi:translation initiation factor IF-3
MFNSKNNFFIKSPTVQLLDENRKPLGVMPSGKAKDLANSKDIMLVLVDGRANPPVYALGNGPEDEILTATVRLLDSDKQMIGVVPADEARKMAKERGEDVIVLNVKADPNVCMLGDRKKYEYDRKKAAKDNEKKQRSAAKANELKELKLPADTSDSSKGDRDRLFAKAAEFLSEGHPVKLSVRFRGRQMAHSQDVMNRLYEEASLVLEDTAITRPVAAGNVFSMMCQRKKK